ncbi:hypothetical protein [Clostridium sp. CF012]|uniref:hypothetical protein n=1 Tax=Clostridium sp. CF012 TaxID=2843319 RepID=UPI001C0AEDFE|nr:hypothetical protein [Clostridium sp. CF012]MBU3141920.1 hypothetical protein [Clostridium sp. CF012]
MNFIEPKNKNGQKVNWIVSEHSRAIVRYYAEYTGYSEEEIVDIFLKNIIDDSNFLNWIHNKRNKKRVYTKTFPNQNIEDEQHG